MKLLKAVRIRPTVPTIDERLGSYNNNQLGKKGALGDVYVEIYEGLTKYEIKWFPIAEFLLNNTIELKKKDFEGSDNPANDAIMSHAETVAREKLRLKGVSDLERSSHTYYSIIQDPWLEEPPLIRNYGFDPYYLNNGAEILIKWFESDGIMVAGGTKWSKPDGSEDPNLTYNNNNNTTPNNTTPTPMLSIPAAPSPSSPPSPAGPAPAPGPPTTSERKSSLIKKIECYHSKSGEQLMLTNNGIAKYSFNEKDTDFTGNIKDIDIIEQFISKWKSKVPNYNLEICKPNYYPTVTLDYISPIETPPETTPPTDNTTATSETPGEKFKLNVVYDTNRIIKSGQDMPKITIYFGDVPNSFSFSDDEEMTGLDGEYIESDFQGEGENLLTLEEAEEIKKEIENQNLNGQTPAPLDDTNVVGLPPKSPGGTGSGLKFPLEFNGVPYYAQWDSRWGSDIYSQKNSSGTITKTCYEDNGSKSTLTTSGCGVTSVTMVINFWAKKGKTGGKFTTPREMGDVFSRNQGRVCGQGSAMSGGVRKYLENEFGLTWKSLSVSQVTQALKANYPVVIGGEKYVGLTPTGAERKSTTTGHYMVATGIDSNGYMRINDPGYSIAKVISAFPNGKVKGGDDTPRYNILIYPKGESAPV